MTAWFTALEMRERLFVAAGVLSILLALFWFALWMPLGNSERDLQARISNWQTSLIELRPLRGRLQSGSQPAAVAGLNQTLVVIVDDTLRTRQLDSALQRSQPTNNNGIRVEFENVAFDALVVWLGDLGSRYGLQVQSASFSNATGGDRGRVNASLTLER